MNEAYGRNVADTEGRDTWECVYRSLGCGIREDRPRETIDAGWCCAPNVYAKIVGKIESLAD